eukprot:1184426-Prorocentrum_minimum.AAC.1
MARLSFHPITNQRTFSFTFTMRIENLHETVRLPWTAGEVLSVHERPHIHALLAWPPLLTFTFAPSSGYHRRSYARESDVCRRHDICAARWDSHMIVLLVPHALR